MGKFSAKWLLKYLNRNQKHIRMTILIMILDRFAVEVWFYGSFSHHLFNIASSLWQFMEWCHSVSLHPKMFWTQKSGRKILTSVFWDKDWVLSIKYMQKCCTIKFRIGLYKMNCMKFWSKNVMMSWAIGFCKTKYQHTTYETLQKNTWLWLKICRPPSWPFLNITSFQKWRNISRKWNFTLIQKWL